MQKKIYVVYLQELHDDTDLKMLFFENIKSQKFINLLAENKIHIPDKKIIEISEAPIDELFTTNNYQKKITIIIKEIL